MSQRGKRERLGKRFLTVLLTLAMIVSLTPSLGALTGGALGAQEAYAADPDLEPVTGVTLNGDILSWDPFPGAYSYSISYADKKGSFGVTEATSVNLKEQYRDSNLDLPAGTYTSNGIVARDRMGNIISAPGAVPDYYYDAYGMTKLDKPQNVRVETTSSGGHRFACDPVPGAATYEFEARAGLSAPIWSATASAPYVDLPSSAEYLFAEGSSYTVLVQANADGYIRSNAGKREFAGWYDGLPALDARLEGDYFYWEPLDGAAKYHYNMSSFGGFVDNSPLDLREKLALYNKPAGTYTFRFYAEDENGIRVSKYFTAEYVYDGQAPGKYAVSFHTERGAVPAVQFVNAGQTAVKPSDPAADGYQFMYWYQKSPSTAFDFSTPITERTALTARWYEKIRNVSITPETLPVEGVTGQQARGTIPEGSQYVISNQYYISGNTGKIVGSSEAFEGGCEYLWLTEFYIPKSHYAVWDDVEDLNIAVPSGMEIFNVRIDEKDHLHVTYSFRTEGYSSPETVDVSNVTIRTTAANPSGTTGRIIVTNPGGRPATVTPSLTTSMSNLISISPNNSFTLQPGASRTIYVTPKNGLAAGHYLAQVKFRTGSGVERFADVSLIVEGEAQHEMSLVIRDKDDNETGGTITVKEGYPSQQGSGWYLWLKSNDSIDDINVTLMGSGFNIGQVLSGWYEQTLPFEYDANDDLIICVYPNDGITEGTYHVTAVITGYEMKPVTADLTFIVAHTHNLQRVDRVAPTCSATGCSAYYHCTKCGKNYSDSGGSDEITDLTQYMIPCISHTFGNWVDVHASTHSAAGERYRQCSVCGTKEYDYPPAVPCVVTFENNGHGTAPEVVEVPYGVSLSYPGDLEEEGWDFLGWYGDPDFENYYDFTAQVHDDITVYAKWEKKETSQQDISGATVEGVTDKTYNGNARTHSIKVILDGVTLNKMNGDYTVKYENNVNAGEAKVTITGAGTYTGKVVKTFQILPKEIVPTLTLSSTSLVYNGKNRSPGLTIKDGSTTLVKGKDYTVSMAATHKSVGKWTITVKPVSGGNYTFDVVKTTFSIVPKATTLKSVTAKSKAFKVTWNTVADMPASEVTGYQIQWSTDASFSKGNHTKMVTGYSTTSYTIDSSVWKSIKGGQKYYVRICVYKKTSSGTYKSAWSKALSVTTKK